MAGEEKQNKMFFFKRHVPVFIENFRYKASVEHDNEYHIKRKLCITVGTALYKKI